MQKAFLKIREKRVEFPDGTIFRVGNVEFIDTGWVVKSRLGQNLVGEEGMIEAFAIASMTTEAVAGYKDGDTELWDVVEIFEKEEEAIKAGKRNGQMTIYQIETGTLKWLD
jgi:hypothetical protein